MVQVGISLGGWLVDRQTEPGRQPFDRAQISEINGKTLECVVSAHRSIRRLQPNDPNRWDRREILELMATPWTHKVSKMTLEQEKLKVKDMANIKPMRLRPLTPGCTACAHHGRAEH